MSGYGVVIMNGVGGVLHGRVPVCCFVFFFLQRESQPTVRTLGHDRSRVLSGDFDSVLPEFNSPASTDPGPAAARGKRGDHIDEEVAWSDSDDEGKASLGDDVLGDFATQGPSVGTGRVPFVANAAGTPAVVPTTNLGRLRNVRETRVVCCWSPCALTGRAWIGLGFGCSCSNKVLIRSRQMECRKVYRKQRGRRGARMTAHPNFLGA